MKLEDVKNAYETLSGTASQIIRQLSLAGIALIWLFNIGTARNRPCRIHCCKRHCLFLRCFWIY